MTRADWLLVIAVIAGLPLLYARLWFPAGPATWLQVQAGDNSSVVVALSPDRQLTVTGPLGNSIIEISNGKARFIHSPCNGKVCIHTGWLQQAGELAACLPNRISIQLLGTHPRFDAINF